MKMIVFILGLAVMAFVAYTALKPHPTATPTVDQNGNVVIQQGQVNPQQQLQNVRNAAKQIENNQNDRLDHALDQPAN